MSGEFTGVSEDKGTDGMKFGSLSAARDDLARTRRERSQSQEIEMINPRSRAASAVQSDRSSNLAGSLRPVTRLGSKKHGQGREMTGLSRLQGDNAHGDMSSDEEPLFGLSGDTDTNEVLSDGLNEMAIQSADGRSQSNSPGSRLVTGSRSSRHGQNEDLTEHSPLLGEIADDDDETRNEGTQSTTRSPERVSSLDPSSTEYDDFHTIDWVNDRQRNRLRHTRLKRSRAKSWIGCCHQLHDAWSGWLVVFLVGVAAGVAAGVIDIGANWMGDLKEGVCSNSFWLNKAACCFTSNDTLFEVDHCSEWREWSQLFYMDGSSASYAVNYMCYLVIGVLFAALSVVLVIVLAPYACGSGIPEVKTILSGFVIRGYLGAWTLLVKAIAMMTAVASGLSLGKEGPLVHVACCCGDIFSRLFPKYRRNEAKKREVLSAAAAAGVSVAFGAPIGGVLFSLEEVSYYFPHKVLWRSFFSALTAMLILTYMNPYFTGKLVLFYANYDGPWHIIELICFIILGVVGGLYGAFFIKTNLAWSKLRKTSRLGNHAALEVIIVALITSLVGFINPFTRGGASQTIGRLFRQCEPADVGDPLCDYSIEETNSQDKSYVFGTARSELWKAVWELVLACIFKGIITIFTFGMKVPAGLFIPSMYVGACYGRIFGILVQQLVFAHRNLSLFKQMCDKTAGCVIPGLYAMVGAAGALGGVTRMTVSLVVIMFELTGGLTYIVPLMVAIVTSKWVGDAFGRDGIYDGHIHLNGYPFMDSKRDFKHKTIAANVMRPRPRRNEPPLQTIPATTATVGQIEHLLEETEYFGFPVVLSGDSQLLAGYVYRTEISRALTHARSSDRYITSESLVYFTPNIPIHTDHHPVSLELWLDKSPFCITDQTPIDTVIEIFRKMGLRHVLVTHNGRLLGIITKKDLLRHIARVANMDPDSIRFN